VRILPSPSEMKRCRKRAGLASGKWELGWAFPAPMSLTWRAADACEFFTDCPILEVRFEIEVAYFQ
jgi:hypothetical protein